MVDVGVGRHRSRRACSCGWCVGGGYPGHGVVVAGPAVGGGGARRSATRCEGIGHRSGPPWLWSPRRVRRVRRVRHMVRPHHPSRTAPAATDRAMATPDVDRDRTVTCPLASCRPPWGLFRVTAMRKSPETRERIWIYTAFVPWTKVHWVDMLDRLATSTITGGRHSVLGSWALPEEKAILSLVTVRTASTG